MADNETSCLPIGTCLEQIEKAVYGREVRKAIHDGIAQCYDDTVEGVNAAQQAASDTQDVIDNAVSATNAANTAATEASNVKVEQTVSGDTVTFTTTKRDGSTVSTSFQKPNVVVSKDEGSGEFSVTAKGWNGEEIIAKIPDPSEEVKSRATIAAVSRVKTALGNPLTVTDGMDAPAVKTVVTLEPKQDLHGYDSPWPAGGGKNLFYHEGDVTASNNGVTATFNSDTQSITISGTSTTTSVYILLTLSITSDVPRETPLCRALINAPSGVYLNFAYRKNRTWYGVNNGEVVPEDADADAPINMQIGISGTATTISQTVMYIELEKGSTAPTEWTPYSNICPIEGYDTVRVTATGKNLAVKAPASLDTNIYNATNLIPVKAGETIYTYALFTSNATTNMQAKIFSTKDVISKTANVVKDLGTFISGKAGSFAITNDGYFGVTYYAGVSSYTIDKMIISREPIVNPDEFADPNTTSLSVAQAAGATVYGGTVTLNEDGSGTLVVDRGCDDLSSLEWTRQHDSNNNTYYFTVNHSSKSAAGSPLISSLYRNVLAGTVSANNASIGRNNGSNMHVRDDRYATVEEFLTGVAGEKVVYNLKTPFTSELTADQLRTLTGKNHVWTDGTKLELTYRADKYADVEKFLNAIPTGTKTGDPAVFTDGADDLPFEKLTIAVEPHQEGTGDPSPDNVRPITGWDEVKVTRCGKNLLPSDRTYTSGIIDDNGTPQSSSGSRYTMPIHGLLPRTQYTIHGTLKYLDSGFRLYYLDANDHFLSRTSALGGNTAYTFTTPDNCYAIRVQANVNLSLDDVQIELGSTATAYEPYTSATLPISLKYATGSTVYGGTVTINRDGTGSVVVDRAVTTLADKTFGDKQSSSLAAGGYISITGFTDWIDTSAVIKSDMLVGTTFANRGADGVISPAADASSLRSLVIFTTKTRDEAVTAYKNATVCYKLSTPTTYTLTAPQLTSLLGNNTVWCDAGQVTVKYKRDIGKMISNLYAMLVDTGAIVIENEEDVTVEGPHYNP